jgi:hypothetical protein
VHRITVIEDFINEDDAKTLISEQRFPSSVNPYPKYYKNRFGGTAFPYNKNVMDILIKYGKRANEKHREVNGFKNPIYVYKAFGSHWTPGTKGELHIDAQGKEPFIEFSTIIYLNDYSEYSGGEIYFPNQDFVYKPKKLSAVFFPSAGSEYIHGITEVTEGSRHTALYMHTSIPQFVDPEFLGDETSEWLAHKYIPNVGNDD